MEKQTAYEITGEIATCPKCQSPLTPGLTECLSCGVILTKVLAQIEEPLQADFRTEFGSAFTEQWQLVVADYENLDVHWNFILACQQIRSLEFAAYRYRRLADVLNDDIALAMLKRIEALLFVELDEQNLGRQADHRDELVRFPRWFMAITYFICALAIFSGFLDWSFHIASLLGTIFLIGILALRFMFRTYETLRVPGEQEVYDYVAYAFGRDH